VDYRETPVSAVVSETQQLEKYIIYTSPPLTRVSDHKAWKEEQNGDCRRGQKDSARRIDA
jgi:hypothetical protein